MTAEQIKARIAELEQRRDQAVATANALAGAIEDCRYWLEQTEKPRDAEAPVLEFVK